MACTSCPLHESATNKVIGRGSPNPEIICIGEAPGEEEDKQGLPFVGKCGKKYLKPKLDSLGRRFALLNVIKCRPPDNRKPKLFGEVDKCIGFLDCQMEPLLKNNPEAVIVIMGRTAQTATIAGKDYGKGKCKYGKCFVLPHPAAMIYDPTLEKIWDDLWKQIERSFVNFGDFIHLHLHTEYSFLDSIVGLDSLFPALIERFYKATGISDHYNMAAIPRAMKLGKKHGILVIPGIEHILSETISENADFAGHITVLALNNKGLENLYRMIGETQYQSTQIRGGKLRSPFTFAHFHKYHEGLVVATACVNGYFNKARRRYVDIRDKDDKDLKKREENRLAGEEGLSKLRQQFIDMKTLMGDRFFMEAMPVTVMYPDNTYNYQIAQELGIPMLSTSDVHYIHKDDFTTHSTLKNINFHSTMKETKAKKKELDNEFWLRTPSQMLDVPKDQELIIQEGFASSVKIANWVDFSPISRGVFIPECKDDCEILIQKLKLKCPTDPIYKTRLEYEISIITEKGFLPYFSIVDNIFSYCLQNKIRAVCRGSVGGSLIAYVLGWHDIDPVRHKIIFERFLSLDRSDPPDIDIDVDARFREKVITEFIIPRFGEDKVAHSVLNTSSFGAKSAIADVCKAWDVEWRLRDEVDAEKMTFPEKFPPEVKKAITTINGLVKTATIHSGAVVVSRDRLDSIVPVEYREMKEEGAEGDKERRLQVRVPYDDLEDLGLIKFDLLRQDSLAVLSDCEELTGTLTSQIQENDLDSWNIIKSGQTDGLFQMESEGMRRLIVSIKPNNIRELADTIALYRPGPMDTGLIDTYASCKGTLMEYCPDTRGILIYQDQVMIILNKAGGISMVEANSVRKIISKKLDGKKILELRNKFMMGGGTESTWKIVSDYQDYGFNKAHATLYAQRGYYMAYYKSHHPMEFFVSSARHSQKNILSLYAYIRTKNLSIQDPCVNNSLELIHYKEGQIYMGLLAISKIGAKTAQKIISGRPYSKYEDLVKAGIPKSIRLNLAKANALRSIIPDAARAISAVEGDGSSLIASVEIDVAKMRREVIDFPYIDVAQSAEYDQVKTLHERFGAFVVHATILQAEREGRKVSALISDETGSANISGWIADDLTQEIGENRIFTLARTEGKTSLFDVAYPGTMSLPKPFGENTDYKITGHIIGISEFKVRHGPNEGRMMANILVRNKSGGANIVIWASQWERIKPHIKKFIPIEWAVRKGDSPGEYSLNSKGE